jgi:hypothetical protein
MTASPDVDLSTVQLPISVSSFGGMVNRKWGR